MHSTHRADAILSTRRPVSTLPKIKSSVSTHLRTERKFFVSTMRPLASLVLPICVLCLTGIAGCQPEVSEQTPPPIKTAEDATGTSDTETQSGDEGSTGSTLQGFDGMAFYVPAAWKKQSLSQMQQGIISARFGVPDVDSELTITLSVSGGGREGNISRWEGQFSGGPPMVQETLRTAGGDADLIRLSGRYSPGFGRPPQEDASMIGLIIPLGQQHYFVKLTGPTDAVKSVEADFIEFCKSARPE
jgi:hypothetical protein